MSGGVLKDRVVVIIGGTSGIGLSAAKACIAHGAFVAVIGLENDDAQGAAYQLGSATRARAWAADVRDPTTAPFVVKSALEHFGRFDALYHVAGGSGRKFGDGPLDKITDEGWQKTLELNLTSVMHSNRAAVQQFLKQKTGGSIVNVSSVLATSPSPKFFATHAYTAAKSAIIGFTRSCAAYYAMKNIRFNVIAPGLVKTSMSKRAADDKQIKKFIKTKQPLDGGRIGAATDIDAAAVYLLSDQSKFVTGQVLAVDGGWCVSEGQRP
jgi:NAD(P)-dependent dehydrogenase (short-subunit alcohol dehydrogenase family)